MRKRHARSGPSGAPASATPSAAPAAPPAGAVRILASLRERKVVQWTLAYAAAAAALLQLVALVAAQFAWPDAVGRSATVVFACGLPIAAVVAWYHGDRGAQRVGGTELSILALLFAIGAALLWRVNAQVDPVPNRDAGPAVASAAATPRIGAGHHHPGRLVPGRRRPAPAPGRPRPAPTPTRGRGPGRGCGQPGAGPFRVGYAPPPGD